MFNWVKVEEPMVEETVLPCDKVSNWVINISIEDSIWLKLCPYNSCLNISSLGSLFNLSGVNSRGFFKFGVWCTVRFFSFGNLKNYK